MARQEFDRSVAESRLSRVVQSVLQLGGTATSGYFAHKFGLGQEVGWGGVVAGFAATAYGTRIGIERGSAKRRLEETLAARSMGVQPIDLTNTERDSGARSGMRAAGILAPLSANTFATFFGGASARNAEFTELPPYPLPPTTVSAALVAGAAIIGNHLSEKAGRTYNVRPILHRLFVRQ